MGKIYFVIFIGLIGVVIFIGNSRAAPVDIPSSVKGTSESTGIYLSSGKLQDFLIASEIDFVKRETNAKADAEGTMMSVKLFIPLGAGVEGYGSLGLANDLAYTYANYIIDKINVGNSPVWGLGMCGLLSGAEESEGPKIFGDIKFRMLTGMEIESVTVDNVTYSTAGAQTDASWKEWQVALGVGKKTKICFRILELNILILQ